MKNPVVRPILAPLVLMTEKEPVRFGFLSKEGLTDWSGTVLEVKPTEQVFIAHPYDLYQDGHWQDYQKYLFEHQMKQPFKQVFRELYVKLEEEQEKDKSLMFAGNQIQPQKNRGGSFAAGAGWRIMRMDCRRFIIRKILLPGSMRWQTGSRQVISKRRPWNMWYSITERPLRR